MSVARTIEFCCSFLLAVVVIAAISLLSLRPTLHAVRSEVKSDWEGFLQAVNERDSLLPTVIEAVKGVEPGLGKLAGKLLEARAVSMRSTDPDRIVLAVDEIDRNLGEIQKVVQSKPQLRAYPSFSQSWDRILTLTRGVKARREFYNKSVRTYNYLLTPFPQNLLTTLFGFVPLQPYPSTANGIGY